MLLFAIKSALAAGFSWEIAFSLLGNEAAALAVVSAVIVVQVTSWQTVHKSIERVLGVVIGVSLAVLIAHFLGLNMWTIMLIVFFAQIVGLLLQNRGQYLATQIPISAALALWSEIAHDQEWAHDYAHLLEEIGSILALIAKYIRSPTVAPGGCLHDRKDLSIHMEHIQQQLYSL